MSLAPHDDPGRNHHPEGAGASTDTHTHPTNHTIVKTGTRGVEMVQLTGKVSLPYSDETVRLLRECVRGEASTIGTNGKSQHVAQDGGLLRHPSGPTPDGTEVIAYPILLVSREHADAIERKLTKALSEFSARMDNVISHGLVPSGQRDILELITMDQRQKHALSLATIRPKLRLITDDGSDAPANDVSTVESDHEASPRDGE